MAQTTTYYGSCLCGEIRFEIQGEASKITRCHCWNCRKQTGSAFMPNITFPASAMKFTSGEDKRQAYRDNATRSGNSVYRHFCKTCGTNFLFSYRPDTGSASLPPDSHDDLEESQRTAELYYSAVDYRIRRIVGEGGEVKEVKEKFEDTPTVEVHYWDKLPWVALLEGVELHGVAPKAGEDA